MIILVMGEAIMNKVFFLDESMSIVAVQTDVGM